MCHKIHVTDTKIRYIYIYEILYLNCNIFSIFVYISKFFQRNNNYIFLLIANKKYSFQFKNIKKWKMILFFPFWKMKIRARVCWQSSWPVIHLVIYVYLYCREQAATRYATPLDRFSAKCRHVLHLAIIVEIYVANILCHPFLKNNPSYICGLSIVYRQS